jgi:hypothetical protein
MTYQRTGFTYCGKQHESGNDLHAGLKTLNICNFIGPTKGCGKDRVLCQGTALAGPQKI